MSSVLTAIMLMVFVPFARAALPAAVTSQPILFVVRNQYQTDHHNTHTMYPSAAHELSNGYYEGGHSALKVFDPVSGSVRTILDAGEDGVVRDPDVSFDGTRILFAWRKSTAGAYHIYEIKADGSDLRQLTNFEDVDDFDPMYLPDGGIVFVSGREPKYVMCNRHLSHNLYRMDADGANVTQIAKSTLFEGHPSLMSDGRILYDRWEYVDRDFGDAQGLWTCDPEGTEHELYWGNNTSSPGGTIDGREIPGTQMAVCTFVACHDKPWGAIAVIDRRVARDGASAVVRTWPAGLESWVKVDASVNGDYDIFASTDPKHEDPYPLADPETGVGGRYFLCSRHIGSGEHMALYLLDAEDGGEILLHDEGEGDVGCFDPMPLAARTCPDVVTVPRKYDDTPGRFYVSDVYKGTHMTGVTRGTVKYLRVVESPEKRFYTSTYWSGQGTQAPGVNWDSFETKRILGTVPVEEDGSANFLAPPRTFVFFQLLDADGMMVQSMRSATLVQPNESQGCIGCHEDRKLAPHPTGARMPAAFQRNPDTLDGWQDEPAKLFNYLSEVQPVFDAKCVSCHDYGGEGASKLVLAGDKGICFNASYVELWRKGYTGAVGAGPAAIKDAMSWGSHASRLVTAIRGAHTNRVTLTAAEFDRIVTWIDLNAVYYPDYAANYAANPAGRSPLSSDQLSQLSTYTGTDVSGIGAVRSSGERIAFDRPEKSPCLTGVTGEAYTNALAIIQAGTAAFAAMPREDMTNCTLMYALDIWREAKYERRLCREAMNRAAIASGVKVYDTQALMAVGNGSSTNTAADSATISGQVVYVPGNETVTVYVAWGTSDGGDTTSGWAHVAAAGTQGTGTFSYAVSDLVAGRPCFYRVFAVNADGDLVSANETAPVEGFALTAPGVYTWSTGTTGAAHDGAGTWNTAAVNWVGTNGVHTAWCNTARDTAAFGAGGAAGEVAVCAGVTIGGLTFDAVSNGTYALTGGPLILTNTPSFAMNAPGVIDATLTGASGFVKTGHETLTLSGTNTYRGVAAIETGTVRLASLPVDSLRLRLDASDASTLFTNANGSGAVTITGQPVGYWEDLSGGGKPATQAILSRRPAYMTGLAAFNGLPVLQFDGVDDDITSALDFNATNLPNVTVMMVYRQVSKTANAGLWGHDNGGWDRMQLLNLASQSAPDCYGVSTSSGWTTVKGLNTNAVLLYTAVLRQGVANGSSVFVNGLADASNGIPAFTSSEGTGKASFTLADIGQGNGLFGNVQIGEVLVFDRALDAGERRNAERYLHEKWIGTSDPLASASLRLHLDASDVSMLFTNAAGAGAVEVSGQPVGYWGDLTGNGNTATQSTLSRRPTYVTGAEGFNGLPVLQFDGSDDDITSSLDLNATNLPNVTIMMVYKQQDKSGNAGLWGHDNGGWDRMQLFCNGGTCYQISTASSATTVKGMATNRVTVYTAVLRNGVANGSYVYIDGVSNNETGLAAFTSTEESGQTGFTLGNISPGNGYRGHLQLGEVLVFDTALDDAARTAAEHYLRNKWTGRSDTWVTRSVLPANSAVRLAAGTVLDLGGTVQTLSTVEGAGAVSNGALTVTDALLPGGTNIVGTLTLPGAAVLTGTSLTVDVQTDGTCDRLVCSGDLSVDGMAFTVSDPGQLNRRKRYRTVSCSGILSGAFYEIDVPNGWFIRYDNTEGNGAVILYRASDTTVFSIK